VPEQTDLVGRGIPYIFQYVRARSPSVADGRSLCAKVLRRTYYYSLLTGVLSVLFHYIHLPKLSLLQLLRALGAGALKPLIYMVKPVLVAKPSSGHVFYKPPIYMTIRCP
jgi:hypothetical protein